MQPLDSSPSSSVFIEDKQSIDKHGSLHTYPLYTTNSTFLLNQVELYACSVDLKWNIRQFRTFQSLRIQTSSSPFDSRLALPGCNEWERLCDLSRFPHFLRSILTSKSTSVDDSFAVNLVHPKAELIDLSHCILFTL